MNFIKDQGSFRDPAGYVFEYNNRIIRIIKKLGLDKFKEIISSDIIDESMKNNFLIETKNVTTEFKNYVNDEDCLLKFYSGITPNNDGKNDVWVIENIEQFPENEVKIFNRWGEEVWYGKNYDNKEVVWEGNNKGGDLLSSSTYFYIADVDGTIYKGWVELTR